MKYPGTTNLRVLGLELLDIHEVELADELAIGANKDEVVLGDLGDRLLQLIFLTAHRRFCLGKGREKSMMAEPALPCL